MNCCPIVELRQYALRPEMRDVLIDLFEDNLIESQEELDMTVIGIFRNLDNPDAFVWLRGFPDMSTRAASLAAFYYGPVWAEHRSAANATMVDSDNILLLREAHEGSGFVFGGAPVSIEGGPLEGRGAVEIIVSSFATADAAERAGAHFESESGPAIDAAGGSVLGYFVAEESENTFRALPVRKNENVLVVVVGYRDRAAYELGSAAIRTARVAMSRGAYVSGPPEVIRLIPTARSRLSGTSEACASMKTALSETTKET